MHDLSLSSFSCATRFVGQSMWTCVFLTTFPPPVKPPPTKNPAVVPQITSVKTTSKTAMIHRQEAAMRGIKADVNFTTADRSRYCLQTTVACRCICSLTHVSIASSITILIFLSICASLKWVMKTSVENLKCKELSEQYKLTTQWRKTLGERRDFSRRLGMDILHIWPLCIFLILLRICGDSRYRQWESTYLSDNLE